MQVKPARVRGTLGADNANVKHGNGQVTGEQSNADGRFSLFPTTNTDYGLHDYVPASERVNALTGYKRPTGDGSNPYQIKASGLDLPPFPTTNSDYGLYNIFPATMRDSRQGENLSAMRSTNGSAMDYWNGKLEAYDRVLQRLAQKPERIQMTPWKTTNAEYGTHTKRLSASVDCTPRKMSLSEQIGAIRASAHATGPLSEKTECSKSTNSGMPPSGPVLPALDHSKYLIAKTPLRPRPLVGGDENQPSGGEISAERQSASESQVPRYGPAWLYMNSRHSRLLQNVENLRGTYKPPRDTTSDILVVETTGEEPAVPGLEGSMPRATRSFPSSASSSLSSSSFATTAVNYVDY